MEMNKLYKIIRTMDTRIFIILCLCFGYGQVQSQNHIQLANDQVKIEWQKNEEGYEIHHLSFKSADQWVEVGHPSGEYTGFNWEKVSA